MESANAAFDLGDWHVDVGGNRLLRGGEVRPLRHKAMALLVLLARHAGQTVARETIVDEVWGGNRYVAEKAINTAVWAIRQALGDDPESPRYVQTVAKRGYRLIAPVRPAAAPADAPGQTPRRTWPVLAATGLILATVAGALLVALQRPPADGVAEALATTTPLTQLPGMEYVGRLSPDGRWLAFAWWQGRGDGRLFVREANTPDAEPRALSGAEGDVEGLAWSPDGAALAYVASDSAGRCTLWRVAPGGGDLRALAPCAALFTPGVDWSPDGSTIVFSGQADGVGGLFLVTPDGQGLRRLTAAPPRAMADHQPVWSPDGRRVAFVRQDPSDGTRDLYETTLDGQARRLTHLRLYHWHGLAWAANGRDLVLSTTQQDRRVLLRWVWRDRWGSKAARRRAVPMARWCTPCCARMSASPGSPPTRPFRNA
jgi:DNA-binding winged helix-turn-helix (wHTH) protein